MSSQQQNLLKIRRLNGPARANACGFASSVSLRRIARRLADLFLVKGVDFGVSSASDLQASLKLGVGLGRPIRFEFEEPVKQLTWGRLSFHRYQCYDL